MEQLLYKDLARYYDLIYSFKDYSKETERLEQLIREYKLSSGNQLLDVACGTGKHLEYLKDKYECVGIDVNSGMLEVARKRLPKVTFIQADMVAFDLQRQFDVITCLFSSIAYVKTYENLKKTLSNFAKHAKPGGVVIIEPWFTKETFKVGTPRMTTYDGEDIKIARLNVSQNAGDVSVMDMHYLVAEKGQSEVKHFVDRHEMGMFDYDKMLEFMKEAGLKTKFLEEGFMPQRGVFIGVSPQ